VCAECSAANHEGLTQHERGCKRIGGYITIKTGPMKNNQTSRDTGWTLA
jgi:hypothetical protein